LYEWHVLGVFVLVRTGATNVIAVPVPRIFERIDLWTIVVDDDTVRGTSTDTGPAPEAPDQLATAWCQTEPINPTTIRGGDGNVLGHTQLRTNEP
jgi:hypothetical protein